MRRLAGGVLLALLGGCTGSLFKTSLAPPTLYMLNPVLDAGGPAAPGSLDLAVLRPHVRAGLDTDRIAALYPDRHLDYFADARWSGPVEQLVQNLAVQLLRLRAPYRNVGDDGSAFASPYWLEISVVDFEAEYPAAGGAPEVHVHLQARVGSAADRRLIASFDADARRPAGDNRLHAIVEAFNQAASGALAEVGTRAAAEIARAK